MTMWCKMFQDILNHLFEDGIGGLDLIALNIQRGRDHGLPGYSKYREKCQIGNGRAKSFQDLSSNMSPNVREQSSFFSDSVILIRIILRGYALINTDWASTGGLFLAQN